MPSMEAHGVVSLWLGHADSRAAFDAALIAEFSADGAFLGSPFSRGFGIGYYEDATREAVFFDTEPTSLQGMLAGTSYADVTVPMFEALSIRLARDDNCAVALYNVRHVASVLSWSGTGVKLRFVGTVPYLVHRLTGTVKLMTDYDCPPLWGAGEDIGPIEPETLPLSAELCLALRAWAASYDQILNRKDPGATSWASQAHRSAFEREGLRLWGALQAELGPAVRVVYHSEMDHRVHEPEEREIGLTKGFEDVEQSERLQKAIQRAVESEGKEVSALPASRQGVGDGPPERAGGAVKNPFHCSFVESFVVLAGVGFALGMGGTGIAELGEGNYELGLTFVAVALLPFGAWAVTRWIVLRRAARHAQERP